MADLIDRSALLERIKSVYCGNCNSDNGDKCRFCEYDVILTLIEGQPTVEKTLSQLRRENIQLRAENEKAYKAFEEARELNDDFLDTIATLKAERDAAVADLEEISFCCNCKQVLHRDGLSVWCGGYADWFEWNDTCTEWEWRGCAE